MTLLASAICFAMRTIVNSTIAPKTKSIEIKRYNPKEFSLDPDGLSDY